MQQRLPPEVKHNTIPISEDVTIDQGTVQTETPTANIGEKPMLPMPLEVAAGICNNILPYMDQPPKIWVKDLREQSVENFNTASIANLPTTLSYDQIIKAIKPYNVYPELVPFIKRLEEKLTVTNRPDNIKSRVTNSK